jgi:hypothetical protein
LFVQEFSFDITGKTFLDMGYETDHGTFLATGPSTTLTFESITPGAYGPVLDNVRVEADCCRRARSETDDMPERALRPSVTQDNPTFYGALMHSVPAVVNSRARRLVAGIAAAAGILLPVAGAAPAHAATTLTFPTGTSAWTVPDGITQINVAVTAAGGGGGGGAGVGCTLAVNPGDVLTITVGAGGWGGSTLQWGGTGGNSILSINGTVQATANGGLAGDGGRALGSAGAAGPGGTAVNCNGAGPLLYDGIIGGNGGGGGLTSNAGGSGGFATYYSSSCPGSPGQGGAGANGGSLQGFPGSPGFDGCVALTY